MNLRFVQITFLLVAILFTVENIHDRFCTQKTTVTFQTRNLADIHFPVIFSFLALPGFNISMLRTFGYGGEYEFFSGLRDTVEDGNLTGFVWETEKETVESVYNVRGLKIDSFC